jgi:hypothetical protein
VPFFCECGRDDCRAHIELTVRQYEAVRTDFRRFALLPHHLIPDVERVVEDHGNYVVVEKDDDLRYIVEGNDRPRAA